MEELKVKVGMLARLIEAFEFDQLQQLAIHYLVAIGYKSPRLTDGWRDGGSDLRVLRADGLSSSIVVQTSVEKNWKGKLGADVKKAEKNYSPSTFIYVSSRRIPELEFSQKKTALGLGSLAMERVDGPALASVFHDHDRGATVLEVAGYPVKDRPSAAPKKRFEEQAAFSFLFLSSETRVFRKAMLAHIARATLESESLPRKDLVAAVQLTAKMSDNQTSQIESVLDSMLTKGEIKSSDGLLQLPDGDAALVAEEAAVLDGAWVKLQRELVAAVSSRVPRRARAAVSGPDLMAAIGSALVLSSETASDDLSPGLYERSALRPQLRERMAELAALLSEWGIVESSARREAVDELIDIASASEAASAISAAELFLALNTLGSSRIGQVFGGGSTSLPIVLLDTSVAMPLLLSALYSPQGRADFISASALFSQCERHEVRLILPGEYLEEAATHLIDAWVRYGNLLGQVPELVDSTNAYVAHYSRLQLSGGVDTFDRYLEGLGVTPNVIYEDSDFHAKRRIVERQLRKSFKAYRVEVLAKTTGAFAEFQEVEEEVRRLAGALAPNRSDLLLIHDARAVWTLDRKAETDGTIFCTHDRLFFELQRDSARDWQVLRPSAVADLLALASAGDDDRSVAFIAPSAWPRYILEAEQDSAARVWDWLAKNRSDSMKDADHLASARRFVDEYVSSGRPLQADAIADLWSEWRDSEGSE